MPVDPNVPGTYVIKNVPNDRLPEVMAACPHNAKITPIPEPDGEWTVIIVIPADNPDPSVLDPAKMVG